MFRLPFHIAFALYIPKHQYILQLFRPKLLHAKPRAIEMTTIQHSAVQQRQHASPLIACLEKHHGLFRSRACIASHRDNRCVGRASRVDMRQQNLIHRCSFTMVFNDQVMHHWFCEPA